MDPLEATKIVYLVLMVAGVLFAIVTTWVTWTDKRWCDRRGDEQEKSYAYLVFGDKRAALLMQFCLLAHRLNGFRIPTPTDPERREIHYQSGFILAFLSVILSIRAIRYLMARKGILRR